MPNPPNITQITPPRVPIIDERTGYMAREWYRYFYNLFYATGGTTGGAAPVDRGGTGNTSIIQYGVVWAETPYKMTTTLNFTFDGTNVRTTGSVTADVNLNAGVDVNAGNDVNADVDVNAGNDVNAVRDVNAGNNVNADVDVNAGNDVNAVRDVNAGRNVNVVGYVAAPTYIDFNTTATTPDRQTGRLYWDNADGTQTLSLCMAGDNAIQQIGEEIYYRIKASSAITEGQVVMFTGTLGASGVLTGAPATGLTAETASYIMGIATENIANNAFGYVTQFGLIRGINTTGGAESWVDGQILYYNPAVAGGLTKTVPTAPNAKIQVCAVVNAGAGSSGSLFIRPTFGGKLGQYEGDVQVTSPANGDLLIYDAGQGRWENATLTQGANITITNGPGSITIAAAGTTGASGSFTTADVPPKTVTVVNGVITSIV
jgi:hypothetical protein